MIDGSSGSVMPSGLISSECSVKVAVRIRPLSDSEISEEAGASMCLHQIGNTPQIVAGMDTMFTFDHVFGPDSIQSDIYDVCVVPLVEAAFEGFNATILAYGQTGSGKTWTMGSSTDTRSNFEESKGIIPRVIRHIFNTIADKEAVEPNTTFKIYVQFLEIYGEDIKDLLDNTRTAKVSIRESTSGDVFISGAKEELVNSPEQMMKALEDGSKFRTTASTRMNQSSSRSHAIFTVILEQSFFAENTAAVDEGQEAGTGAKAPPEIRKCKFHFVDLAGSERAKRTGASGQHLKEGIDINRGLLALGNVISALGDEQKRGKVHVPYRDSKLTRMLQDSLGGNSKTLVICCASPSALNYNESVNALRYANRARNIQNKPVVNRDPTMILIDEMKVLLMRLAVEVKEARNKGVAIENGVPTEIVDGLTRTCSEGSNGPTSLSNKLTLTLGGGSGLTPIRSSTPVRSAYSSISPAPDGTARTIVQLKARAESADFEVTRLTENVKQAKQQASAYGDQVLLLQSERDYFKMKWREVAPPEEMAASGAEQSQHVSIAQDYLREIDSLKKQLASEKLRAEEKTSYRGTFEPIDFDAENEFTSSVARVIAQTREQLEKETRLLAINSPKKDNEEHDAVWRESGEELPAEIPQGSMDVEDEEAYQMRQKGLRNEMVELGESIHVKEQLIEQLQRSQYQYEAMKVFYESKLQSLGEEMCSKQSERDQLASELQELAQSNDVASQKKMDRESVLRENLKKKDEELKIMRKKQEELNHLSQLQGKYVQQAQRLQQDIEAMKKQRVELTKTLQSEKKKHLEVLSGKAREIERLKRSLQRSAEEARKLNEAKGRAELRTREALRENAMARKRSMEMQKIGSGDGVISALRSGNTSAAVALKVRAARQAMTHASRASSHRILSEEEAKTKSWLDKRIAEIAAKEHAAESLRRQCEQQLQLLNRKELLEGQKLVLMQQSLQDVHSLTEGRSDHDEANMDLQDLADHIENLDGQLESRQAKIADMQQLLDSVEMQGGDKTSTLERTIETLKRSAAQSLPAAHEVLRLLFDMLVQGSRHARGHREALSSSERIQKKLAAELEESNARAASLARLHDTELARVTREYEERLHGLLAHPFTVTAVSNRDLTVGSESPSSYTINKRISSTEGGMPLSPNSGLMRMLSVNKTPWTWTSPNKNSAGRASMDGGGVNAEKQPNSQESEADGGNRMQLLVAHETVTSLRAQLNREAIRSMALQNQYDEVAIAHSELAKESKNKDVQIKFLEDECRLFREIADGLKAGLKGLSKDGVGASRVSSATDAAVSGSGVSAGSIIKQVRERMVRGGGLSSVLEMGLGDEDEDDDDSASMIGQFDSLAEEIDNIGTLAGMDSLTKGGDSKGVVFNRLTNPSNFTGSMKKVFEQDVVMKRRKVKEIKSKEMRHGDPTAFTAAAGRITAGGPPKSIKDDASAPLQPLVLTALQNSDNTWAGQGGQGLFNGTDSPVGMHSETGSEGEEWDRDSPASTLGSHAHGLHQGESDASVQKSDIYERLANPSRFTGIHRKAFAAEDEKDRVDKGEENAAVSEAPSRLLSKDLQSISDRLYQSTTQSQQSKKLVVAQRGSTSALPKPPSALLMVDPPLPPATRVTRK